MRSIIVATVAALAFASAAHAGGPTPAQTVALGGRHQGATHAAPPPKACKTGKLCGNACIPKGNVCHQ